MSTIETPQSAISFAPPPQWHDHDYHGHVVQFYSEDEFLVDAISRFLGVSLAAGDAAIVLATKTHREGIARKLKERGLDVTSSELKGRYFALDAAETLSLFMLDGIPDVVRFRAVIGGVLEQAKAAAGDRARATVFGEMVALLWAAGKRDAAIRLEELWNDLAQTHAFSLRCAYPMADFHREEHSAAFRAICEQHSGVIPGESYTSLASEADRLRNITYLQQKAQALETERAERKLIQRSLQRREAELADFLENALEGVEQVGANQKILWANKAVLKLLGYSAEEYVSHNLADFYLDRNVFDRFWQKLMRGEEIYDFPAQLKCRDGSLRDVLIRSNPVWERGKLVYTRSFVRDVTEQKRVEQALRESEAQLRSAKEELEILVEQRTSALRRLSAHVLSLQDLERRRIARELHDSFGQYLAALKLNIEMLRQAPANQKLWSQSEDLMEQCIIEVRTLSYLLHPPMMEEAGLASAARWYVEGFGQRSGIAVTLEAPDDLERLPDTIEIALFRALQEALTNVHRHSHASAVHIQILHDAEQVIVEIKDNGCGIPQEGLCRFNELGTGMGVGLSGMRERIRELCGELKIESNGCGTSLQITIPIAVDVPGLEAI